MILLLLACSGTGATDSKGGTSPTLSSVQSEVFNASCAFSTCHAAPGASGLVLEDGSAWSALVTVESADNPGAILVIPGDANGSYLVQKLRGDAGIVGDEMPAGNPLDAERIQLVVDWIDAGAADD